MLEGGLRAPPGQAKKDAYSIKAELRVPSVRRGHSILVSVTPLDPGGLDQELTDSQEDPMRWLETQTLVGTRTFEVKIEDGRGRILAVLAPGLTPFTVAFDAQDASVVFYLSPER